MTTPKVLLLIIAVVVSLFVGKHFMDKWKRESYEEEQKKKQEEIEAFIKSHKDSVLAVYGKIEQIVEWNLDNKPTITSTDEEELKKMDPLDMIMLMASSSKPDTTYFESGASRENTFEFNTKELEDNRYQGNQRKLVDLAKGKPAEEGSYPDPEGLKEAYNTFTKLKYVIISHDICNVKPRMTGESSFEQGLKFVKASLYDISSDSSKKLTTQYVLGESSENISYSVQERNGVQVSSSSETSMQMDLLKNYGRAYNRVFFNKAGSNYDY